MGQDDSSNPISADTDRLSLTEARRLTLNALSDPPQLRDLRERFTEQEHELHVHQIELEIQNEELRRANAELERSHSRYADLFEFAPVGYLVFGDNGLIEDINLTGCRQLGGTREQLIGRRLSLFIEEGERTAFANLLRGVFIPQKEGLPPEQRIELTMKGLDDRPWDAQLECVRQPEPGRNRARVTLTEITALKNAQREIEHLNQTLELRVEQRIHHSQQLSEEMATFVYSVTHDMTRPMRQIQGFLELLTKHLHAHTDAELDQKSLRYLENLSEATAQMNLQVTSLIRYFQSSQSVNQPRQTDLNYLIETVIRELKPETAGRVVHLTHDPLPTLLADQQGLQTVFSNLLSNAIKFTRPRIEAQIHVGVEMTESGYLFSVRDNGVGFDTRQNGRMFGLFQRLHSERSFEGQGMGLALVRRIVNNAHGRVWAESVPDEGSVFWIQLPGIDAMNDQELKLG